MNGNYKVNDDNYPKNLAFLMWFVDANPINGKDIDKIYHKFMSAFDEDRQVFMKISLYAAGKRKKYKETHYKLILHFLATNYPEKLMSNIQLFVKFGHISDLLYLLQEPVVKNRVHTFIKYHAGFMDEYKKLLNDECTKNPYKSYFPYKLIKLNYESLLSKILNDKEINNVL